LSTSVGRRAEVCVERWLEEEGWTCFERNMRVPGGEIDRLFVRERCLSGLRVDLCVAEVKATRLTKGQGICHLFSAAKIRSLIRPQQLRTLWRSAAAYEHQLVNLTKAPVRTYVRYFLVVYGNSSSLKEIRAEFKKTRADLPVRLCRATPENLIFSWSPDVIEVGW
jgi:Holliday junction resolvase-like predicted endonuclease